MHKISFKEIVINLDRDIEVGELIAADEAIVGAIDQVAILDKHLENKFRIKCFKTRGRVSSFFHSSFSPLSNPCGEALTLRGQLSNPAWQSLTFN